VTGRTYRLQYNRDFSSSGWSNLMPDVLATGPTAVTTDDIGTSTQRLYRVILLP
jgi:hypothetical protein